MVFCFCFFSMFLFFGFFLCFYGFLFLFFVLGFCFCLKTWFCESFCVDFWPLLGPYEEVPFREGKSKKR